MTEYAHTPVMSGECINLLSSRNNSDLFVDANTGEGGHSFAFLSAFVHLKMVCIDADSTILDIAKKRLEPFKDRIYFYNGWSFDFFTEYPSELKRPDFILFDLGVSSFHYKLSGKGFSFEKDEYLDMRIDSNGPVTAAELIARLPEKELADLIYNNSGERYSRRIASLIVNERQKSAITSTSALAGLINRAVPASYSQQAQKGRSLQRRHGQINPATRTFQALRIAVNGELSKLHALLEAAFRVLEPGGRLAVISFHSLEDKIVKNFIRERNKNCICPPQAPICNCSGRRSVNVLTKKGIIPSNEEIERNPPSRSARLRVVEKILDGDDNG